jgi:hypothetical protein
MAISYASYSSRNAGRSLNNHGRNDIPKKGSVKTCEDCEGLLGIFPVMEKLMSLGTKHVKSSQSSQVFTPLAQVLEITEGGFWAMEGRPFSCGVE